MNFIQIALLALVQGFAELLPVSSSAHVILTEKLLGLDPTRPEMTLLLVLLHTGTMFSVLVYFTPAWKRDSFRTPSQSVPFLKRVMLATLGTALTGGALLVVIKKAFGLQVEDLFGDLAVISAGLACAGLLILWAAARGRARDGGALTDKASLLVGLVQGLCLPFRGFSRSGATISTGLLAGVEKRPCEEFSFALAVVITPPVIAKEAWRLYKAQGLSGLSWGHLAPDLLGLVLSFLAGLAALKWLSGWLEKGRWGWFGAYCLAASVVVAALHFRGL